MVLPREGALTGTTNVHIYGRNFTRAICKNITCYFGEEASPKTMYISNNHIICQAPDISHNLLQNKYKSQIHPDPVQMLIAIAEHSMPLNTEVTVPVSVDFGDGTWISVGQNFTYKHEQFTTTTTPVPSSTDPDSRDSASVSSHCTMLYIVISFLCAVFQKLQ